MLRKSSGLALILLGTVAGLPGRSIELPKTQIVAQREINLQEKKAEADRLLQQGIQQYQVSQFEAAFQSWQQSLKLYRAIKDRQREGTVLRNIGNLYYSIGNYVKAIEYQEQSLVIAREIKDRQGEGGALGNLGIAYHSLGNLCCTA